MAPASWQTWSGLATRNGQCAFTASPLSIKTRSLWVSYRKSTSTVQSNFRLLRQTGRYPRFSLLNPFGKSVSSSSLAKLWIAYGSTALTSTDQYPSYLRHTITIRGKTKRFCTLNRGNHRNLHRGRHVELKSSTCICHQSVNSVPVLSLFRSISSAGFAIFWTA